MAAPIMKPDKNLAVVVSRVLARLDHEKAMLAAVLRFAKVVACEGMRVEPAKSGRIGLESVPSRRSGGDHRRAFFHGSIDLRRKKQTVPVDHFGIAGEVANFDCLLLPLAHAEKRARNLAVVCDSAEVVFRGRLKRVRSDLKRDVRC